MLLLRTPEQKEWYLFGDAAGSMLRAQAFDLRKEGMKQLDGEGLIRPALDEVQNPALPDHLREWLEKLIRDGRGHSDRSI